MHLQRLNKMGPRPLSSHTTCGWWQLDAEIPGFQEMRRLPPSPRRTIHLLEIQRSKASNREVELVSVHEYEYKYIERS